MKNLDEYFDNLVDHGIATDKEIRLVANINGWNEQTFNNILYARTGYRNWEQFIELELKQ